LKVLVLMGGMSAEREISLKTGAAVAAGLSRAGHEVETFDLSLAPGHGVRDFVASSGLETCDVVFLALHGGEGEDGRIQALLGLMAKPFTGSGVLASGLCMDKSLSKILFERNGIPTPAWFEIRAQAAKAGLSADGAEAGRRVGEAGRRGEDGDLKESIRAIGGYPVVIKPVDQGSTIGITIVGDPAGLEAGILLAERYSPRLVFERYIAGRELSVAIVGDQVFPVIEIVPRDGFYDFERKYTKGMTLYHCPAEIDDALAARISREALAAYRALGCDGFGRVDLRLAEDGIPYFLEINTIPGMTETSLVPMAAAEAGYSFSDLVDMIVGEALKKAGG
jgi:D-alanine-D-alanine ligase